MDNEFQDFNCLQEDKLPTHRGKIHEMKRWIQNPSSIFLCAVFTLCTLLLITNIIITVVLSNKDMKKTSASLEQIKSAVTKDKDMKKTSAYLEQIKSAVTKDKDMKETSASLEQIKSAVTKDKDMKEISASLEQIMSETTSRDSQKNSPTSDWYNYGEHSYYYSKEKKSWSDAKKYCEDQKSHLVVINSKEEQDEMNVFTRLSRGTPWIGLTDMDGEWKWVDGTPYNSSPKFWEEGQPDNWYGHGLGGGEDCAQIQFAEFWNDDHCSISHEFICEKSSL